MASETVADILREMRENEGISGMFAPMEAIWITDFRAYIERIEAAVRRIRSRCYAALDSEYDCAHGHEIREAFKGEVKDGV